MVRPRFFAPDLDPNRTEVVLSAEESHHLVRVMRLVNGDEVAVFDGRGHEFQARVSRADRTAAHVEILEPLPSSPEPNVPTVLVQAVLKGDKMDGVVRDATMAGAIRIVPILTERTLVSLSALTRSHARERWMRIAVSSAKQCRRSRLPEIDVVRTFPDWLSDGFDGRRLLLTEPASGAREVRPMRAVLGGGAKPVAVACVVGPEGGWGSDERRAALEAGCDAVSLGPMTLRADAVGLVAISLVSFAFEDVSRP
jgi:16S rRNA (uracil1498-N3)-methyltransferase